jgi:hypothetical protein
LIPPFIFQAPLRIHPYYFRAPAHSKFGSRTIIARFGTSEALPTFSRILGVVRTNQNSRMLNYKFRYTKKLCSQQNFFSCCTKYSCSVAALIRLRTSLLRIAHNNCLRFGMRHRVTAAPPPSPDSTVPLVTVVVIVASFL